MGEVLYMYEYDVIVVGGGLTGVAAAVSAAREGMKTMLIEQSGFLGGALGNCLVNPFMAYHTKMEVDGEMKKVDLSAGIFTEIVEKLNAFGVHWKQGVNSNGVFHEEYMKLILDRMTVEAGVTVLLHSTLAGVEKSGGMLTGVTVVGKSGKMTMHAKCFIDCTGDADLAVMAGCPTHLGREKDNLCQPMTLCFRLANVDMEKFKANREKINPLYQQLQAEGKIRNPRENVLIFFHPVKNMLHFNTTRVIKLNPTDPFHLTRAEMEAREQMFEMYHFLKENIEGFENADIAFSAPQIGVRESRMIDGLHLLNEEELKNCTKFEDAIAAGNYDIDIHNPEGAGTSHYYFKDGEYYTIPYRCLIPKNADNLLVAGRCISSTHEAQASYRIMPIVTTLGQAAGVAAAVALKQNVQPKDADIHEIQRILKAGGAFLGI